MKPIYNTILHDCRAYISKAGYGANIKVQLDMPETLETHEGDWFILEIDDLCTILNRIPLKAAKKRYCRFKRLKLKELEV